MVDRLVHSEANRTRIESVEKCFGASGIKLLIPNRVLVGEGILTKSCRKKLKKRQFFLFNDIMVYGNIVINKKKYNKQHIIPLESVTLEDIVDQDINKNGWFIKTPNKSFGVYAATPTEKQEWMAHINKCIDELLRRTGKSPSSAHAAVWVPDTESKMCMHCKKAQFTVINRRHHCRNCGLVICGNCSKNKFLIPSQSSKPVRVCDSCFEDLCSRRVSSSDHLANPILANPPPYEAAKQSGSNNELSTSVDRHSDGAEENDAAESTDSDEDSTDPLETATSNISIEDEKPIFYSEVSADAAAATAAQVSSAAPNGN